MQQEFRSNRRCGAWVLIATAVASWPATVRGEAPARVELASPGDRTPSVVLTPDAEIRIGIETIVIESRELRGGRTVGGEMMVPSGGEITLAAPVAGVLLRDAAGRFPAVGDRVHRGQVLLRLLALPADRDLFTARQELARAETRLTLVRARAKRTEELLHAEAGSVRQVEEATAELADAMAAQDAASARLQLFSGENLDAVAGTLGALELRAPESGLVRAVHVASGQSIAAATVLVELVRPDPLWVRVPVYAGDTKTFDLSRGARIRTLAAPASAPGREARPVSAPPAADPRAASIDLFFVVANADGEFRPGQRVHVTLTRRDRSSGLTVPSSAVIYDVNGESWVYERRESRTFTRRPVEIAAAEGTDLWVTRGLAPGMTIVSVGAAELYGVEFHAPAAGHGGGH